MKDAIMLYLLLQIALQLNGQPEIPDTFHPGFLQQHTYYFQLQEDTLYGEGANKLKAAIAEARFAILGEYHGSHQLPKLTTALLPHLHQSGYHNLALEVGPYSARILDSLSADPPTTAQRLYELYSHYAARSDIPIPFYDGVEGAKVLAEASRLGFRLWGLDQEYFDAPLMLADELLKQARGQEDYAEVLEAKNSFDSLFQAALKKDEEGIKGYRMFQELTESPVTKAFFASFPENNRQAQEIISALYTSWDIYDRHDLRDGFSHAHRIAYIRQNFLHHYQAAEEEQPKVFVQIGALHAAKGYEFGVYDVGNLIHELAEAKGASSCHIYSMPRYSIEEGVQKDALEEQPQHPESAFRAMGRPGQWALIELSGLREQLASRQLILPEGPSLNRIKFLSENFDWVAIPPTDQGQQNNYSIHKSKQP
ncbi:MAG: hypothetical protein KDD10_16145 [Phaeodactylibacter sp.]|nr:hypothetical protein [Phaeodactylibacter sp.]MCB9292469.1 hypothetical protein [Lewinellaceae bacterium]